MVRVRNKPKVSCTLAAVYKPRGPAVHITAHSAAMKTVILTCLAAVAIAAPQFGNEPRRPVIQVLRYSSADDGNGNFNYEYEGENGIYKSVVGTPGAAGQSNMRGVFR
ncbi:Cuticle protein AMP1A [Portunus trituberculatus]|uniref:Cuticle protein AMP1A n=1 Tax=Portunus trituberculatus TaxID=210409 RepID=A0A5B7JRK4_PORTR|nr:Cuticle protein AMP1A [Portunus trituberculatus]